MRSVRLCVKDVLENLLHSQEGVERPELPSYLCKIVDGYLQKKHDKAEEIVNYLAKAELMKRFTQDESYKRIILKVENLAEQMSVRLQGRPFPENDTDVPVEQVVERGTDDDIDGISMAFIRGYYFRVQEQFKKDRDVEVAKSQVGGRFVSYRYACPPTLPSSKIPLTSRPFWASPSIDFYFHSWSMAFLS